MKPIHYVLISILSFSLAFSSFGQSQSAMNTDQSNRLQHADKELNTVYRKILKQYSSDAVFIKNLKAAQRIWLQLRDADIKMKYPDRPDGYYGTAQPMCEANYRTELTQLRTKTLNVWLTGIEEGDVCAGSVKMKN
jgi:uncharacterized protein YecT (DUF1311 family)